MKSRSVAVLKVVSLTVGAAILFVGALVWVVAYVPASARTAQSMPPGVTAIAHGLGGYEGHVVTNTRSAFEQSYAKGYRWFEMDFRITKDNVLIGHHDSWYGNHEGKPVRVADVSLETVRAQGPFGNDLATFADALSFLEAHSDMYLILDPKDDFITSHRLMNNELRTFAKNRGSAAADSVRQRIVPQFYFRWQYTYLKKTFKTPMLIFTLYLSGYTDEEVLNFVRRNRVSMVTMS